MRVFERGHRAWSVVEGRPGNPALEVFQTKAEALTMASAIARTNKQALFIHRIDGTVQRVKRGRPSGRKLG